MARHAQLQDEIVDDFLRAALVERALFQVALKVDVEEGGDAAEAHRRAVLLLDRREVGEVDPLHGLARVFRRAGDVVAVHFRHLLHVVQRRDLVRDLLHEADRVGVDRFFAELRLVRLLLQDQAVHAVQRDTAVVADDAPAAVGVRQARDDARVARGAHVVGIGGENAVVVRLVVFEFVFDRVGNLIAVGLAGGAHHAHAAERVAGALQRLVRLQADDDLVLLVEIAGAERGDRDDRVGVDLQHAAVFLLLAAERLVLFEHRLRAFGRRLQKGFIAGVRRVVFLDEIAYVDLFLPLSGGKASPSVHFV